ncbi:MAG: glycosyltransferase family 2 protein [Alphaproteobacteria bacterium]|nr:glycosyltransferase family 2 protein [Alphaproteobacteria bacterium]
MAEPAPITVIIPAWRAAATIGRTLASIAAQTRPPRRVVVVDDESDDDTLGAARACTAVLAAVGSTLTVVRQAKGGPGAARNRALAEADTPYVAFIDADDEWLPAKLERSLAHIEGTDLVLVSHDFLAEQPDGSETYADCTRHFRAAADPFAALFVRAYVATTTVVARRDAVLAAGGFDPTLPAAQDYDLWLAMLGRPGARFLVFPEALTRYRFSPAGITSKVEQRRRCSLAVMARHAPTLRSRGLAGLVCVGKRALVIHYEAACAHRRQGRRIAGLGAGLMAAPALVRAVAALLGPGQPETRAAYSAPLPPQSAQAMNKPTQALVLGLSILWIVVVLVDYYTSSSSYYSEKLSVFSRFLLGVK